MASGGSQERTRGASGQAQGLLKGGDRRCDGQSRRTEGHVGLARAWVPVRRVPRVAGGKPRTGGV
jgi:hypothetical protein